MSTCPNCKSKLTCGCQKRTASNGSSVCSTCISSYEASLKKAAPPANGNTPVQATFTPHKNK